MREYYRIDDDGYYIGPVLRQANSPDEDKVIKEPFPNHLNKPFWTGEMWIEGGDEGEITYRLKESLVTEAKQKSEQEMASQYPDSNNWLVDYTLDYGVGRRPNQDQRMRRVNEIREKRDRFLAAVRSKSTPGRLRTMRWEDEGTWA